MAGENAAIEYLVDALFDRRDHPLRDRASDDRLFEHAARSRLTRLDTDLYMRVLTTAPGLCRVPRLPFRSPGYRFLVCDLDVADVRVDAETMHELTDGRVELVLAGGSDRYHAIGAALHNQRRIV